VLTKEIPVPLVSILWDDADATNEWTNEIPEEDDGDLVHTIGFLVKTTKQSYYIAHTVYLDENDQLTFNGRLRIPKGMVRSYDVLVEAA